MGSCKKKSKRPATPGEDEVEFSHERTREERDAEGRANAIDLDAGEAGVLARVRQRVALLNELRHAATAIEESPYNVE